MLHIKKATTADIALIRELAMEVWPQTYTPIVGAEQVAYMLDLFYSAEALREQMEEREHLFVLAYEDERPVGFASYSEEEAGIYKLHKLYILPTMQGKGTGRQMVRHILDDLKARGAAMLRLNVNRYNTTAKIFYERYGFTHIKDEDIDIGSGYYMNDHVLETAVG